MVEATHQGRPDGEVPARDREETNDLARRSKRDILRAVLPPGIAVLIAAVLSLPRLGSRTMWLDEVYTVGATNQLFQVWRETGATQALYYLLVWPISRVSIEPVWIRLPSALFALAAVVVVHEVGRRIGGRVMGALAAGGLAISWGLARYAIEARGYTLSLLLVSLSWLALIAIAHDGSMGSPRRWWRIYVVAALLAPLAHGLSVLHFVAQGAAMAIAPGGRRWLRGMGVVAVCLAVELTGMAALGVSEVGDWVDPLNLGQIRAIKRLLLGHGGTGTVLGVLAAVATWRVLSAYWRTRSLETWRRVVPAFWALGPPALLVAISLIRPYAASRYVFAAIPGFVLLIADLVTRLRPLWGKILASSAIALLLLNDQGKVTTVGLEDWSGLTACIRANAVDGDRFMTARSHRPPIDYYWSRSASSATVEPVVPPDPLGDVKRLYRPPPAEIKDILLTDTSSSVWYIERLPTGRAFVAAYAFDPNIADRYEMTDWFFEGDLTLVRFDPLGAERPASVPCDTVPKPEDS